MTDKENRLLALRRAGSEDCRLYYEWSQDPSVRANSYGGSPFPFEAHERWFAQKLLDAGTLLYVLESGAVPAGQIRYEIRDSDAEINFSIAREFRSRGLGKEILMRGERRLLADRPDVGMIHGYVLAENEPSRRAFLGAGYNDAGEELVNGRCSIKFVRLVRITGKP